MNLADTIAPVPANADLVLEGYVDPTEPFRGEDFKRPWPPLIKMDESVRKKMNSLFGNVT